MNLVFFDDHSWNNLLPLTFTRPVCDLRIGILTISEKWEQDLGGSASYLTRQHLSGKFPFHTGEDNIFLNGSLLPDESLVNAVRSLESGRALKKNGVLLAARIGKDEAEGLSPAMWIAKVEDLAAKEEEWISRATEYGESVSRVEYPWDIFTLNGQEIEADFARMTAGRQSENLSATVQVVGTGKVFVEPGFQGECFTINTASGPVYLGPESEIMEGSLIRGPFALCEGSVVKMSAKFYGPTTIGPYCRVGGEINNSVIQANSNKSHDGFLGNSVIGEWCNLGADTNNSNLKNNYSEVKMWNYPKRRYIRSGRQFCGLIMGDHSKTGINTMFNTGTVVGVSANIFGPGFPRTFIPSFSWGGADGFTTYRMEKVVETARLVLERRDQQLTEQDLEILDWVFRYSEDFRKSFR